MKISVFAVIGLTFTSFSPSANALEAMRCNVQTSPGIYEPVLRVVFQGGSRDIRLGADGLTRKIFYRDHRALAYLSSEMGISKKDLPRRVSRTCGAVEEDAVQTAAAPVAPVAPPAPPSVGEGPRVDPGDTDIVR